jgi:hypothetical protein
VGGGLLVAWVNDADGGLLVAWVNVADGNATGLRQKP